MLKLIVKLNTQFFDSPTNYRALRDINKIMEVTHDYKRKKATNNW